MEQNAAVQTDDWVSEIVSLDSSEQSSCGSECRNDCACDTD